jgi:Putative adhesin
MDNSPQNSAGKPDPYDIDAHFTIRNSEPQRTSFDNPYAQNPYRDGYSSESDPYKESSQSSDPYENTTQDLYKNSETPYYSPPPSNNPAYASYRGPERRLRPGWRRIFILLLVCLLILGVLFFIPGIGTSLQNTWRTITHTQTSSSGPIQSASSSSGNTTVLTVTEHPTLIIDSQVANTDEFSYKDVAPIHIHVGTSDTKITLQAVNIISSKNSAQTPDNNLIYEQTQAGTTTILHIGTQYQGNIDIAVPTTTDLRLTTSSSSINVNGVTGQMVLTTSDAPINITNSTMNGPTSLDSNSGNIKVLESRLHGPVIISNNQGPITFNGTFDPQGNYQISGNSGLLDITIPKDASFHLDAKVSNGTLSADFPGVQVQQNQAQADIGNAPSARLTLSNNTGTIKLHSA